jgi:uncharacterized membrane protein
MNTSRVDEGALLLNIFQLMLTAFIPFPTAVLAEALHRNLDASVATAFYGGTLTLLGLIVNVSWFHAAHNRRLLDERVSPEMARQLSRRYLIGPLIYLLATALTFISPWLAVSTFALVNLFYLWPRRAQSHQSNAGNGENS